MNKVAMFGLMAVFAAPLHAQVCSGGADGGADSTGNQCNDAAMVRAVADVPYMAFATPLVGSIAVQTPTASRDGMRSTPKLSAAVSAPSAALQASKVEALDASPCAGGPDGGMDVTGNECSQHPAAGTGARLLLAGKP